MKNVYCSVVLLLLWGSSLWSQNPMAEKGRQLVYFQDGSIVKGVILTYELDKRLVMLVGGAEVALPADQVEYITRGRQGKKYERQMQQEDERHQYAFSERGLYNVSSFAVNVGADIEGTTAGVNVQHVIGYQLNRWVGMGVGAGLDLYDFGEEKPFISVFGDVRGYLTETKAAPFYAFQMGYGFMNDQRLRDARGGLLVYPAVGIRLSGRAGSNVSLDMGYKYQDSYWEFGSAWNNDYTFLDYRYHRYVFRVSVTF